MKLIVITGPAGSGKSSLALDLYKKFYPRFAWEECSCQILNNLGINFKYANWKDHANPSIVELTRKYLQDCGSLLKKDDSLYIVKGIPKIQLEADYLLVTGVRTQHELNYLAADAEVSLHIKLKGKELPTVDYSHESEKEVRELVLPGHTVFFNNDYDENFFTSIECFMHTWLPSSSSNNGSNAQLPV